MSELDYEFDDHENQENEQPAEAVEGVVTISGDEGDTDVLILDTITTLEQQPVST